MRGWGAGDEVHTWFLKEVCCTGSSAAREMLLSRMKKRIRLVKMESLTMRWHWRRNLRGQGEGAVTQGGVSAPSWWVDACVGGVWVLQPEPYGRRGDTALQPVPPCPPTTGPWGYVRHFRNLCIFMYCYDIHSRAFIWGLGSPSLKILTS